MGLTWELEVAWSDLETVENITVKVNRTLDTRGLRISQILGFNSCLLGICILRECANKKEYEVL